MRIIIFEGIATSGKSTVISGLAKSLHHKKVLIADEADTHEPIMHQVESLHIEFFNNLVDKLAAQNTDFLLIDRFYLTQAFRAQAELNAYGVLEDLLLQYQPLTIYLQVNELAIADRIAKAAVHRESEWAEYVKTKGKSMAEIANYYIVQQKNQLRLLKQSKIPYKIFNTTNHDYQNIITEIKKLIN
jgi:thymidylate kinase